VRLSGSCHAIHGLNAFEWINLFGPKWERKRIEKRLGRGL
jgi:hypothetical protein